jgi:hypothetical protein
VEVLVQNMMPMVAAVDQAAEPVRVVAPLVHQAEVERQGKVIVEEVDL